MRIIFIEGISGVGKSTTTEKLCDRLRTAGLSAHAYLESDCKNPIDFYDTAYFTWDEYEALLAEYGECSDDIEKNTVSAGDVRLIRYSDGENPLFEGALLVLLREREFCFKPVNLIPLAEYTRAYELVWKCFAQRVVDWPGWLIFDGSLLHHPVTDMMRNYGASSDQIIAHISTLLRAVDRLSPSLIYLSSESVVTRLRSARASRGQTAPTDKQVAFWEDRKRMDLAVIDKLAIPRHHYDISRDNWDAVIDNIVLDVQARGRH